jgi:hypothetical protein
LPFSKNYINRKKKKKTTTTMPLHERTSLPHWLIAIIGLSSWGIILISCTCTYILLQELRIDYTNPIDLCERINHLKPVEIVAHFIMSIMLIFRGWWVVGLANFPFLYYHTAQCIEGEHLLDPERVYYALRAEMVLVRTKIAFFLFILICHFLDHMFHAFYMVRRPITKINTKFNFFWNSQVSH